MNLPADPRTTPNAISVQSKRMMRAQYTDFLPDAQAVAESQPAPLARTLVLVVAGMFLVFVLWATYFEVEQVASAPGVIRPAGKVKIVNHPDGGRVANVLVAEGNKVKAGQILIELDPEVIREEIKKRKNEWQALSAQAARLEAEAVGQPPTFDLTIAAERPDLVETHRQLYEARRQSLAARRLTSDQVAAQRARDVALQEARLSQQLSSYKILKEQENALKQLAKKGYFPKLRFLTIKRQVSELQGQIAQTRQSLGASRSALSEAQSRRNSVDEEWRSEVLTQLAEARARRNRAKSSLVQEESRLRNLQVRAPTAGVVKDLTISAAGQAIRSNDPLMKIVPSGDQLIVETRVSNADIGFIKAGQKATVKIRTYDFIRHGTLAGVVEKVAADATEDSQTGQLSFTVTVRTKKAYLGRNARERPVNPGMEADVDLLIGSRSIISYLTDRVQRTASTSFTEN